MSYREIYSRPHAKLMQVIKENPAHREEAMDLLAELSGITNKRHMHTVTGVQAPFFDHEPNTMDEVVPLMDIIGGKYSDDPKWLGFVDRVDALYRKASDKFMNFLESIKSANPVVVSGIMNAYSLCESRRYSKKYSEDETPLRDDDVMIVYHGFNYLTKALTTAKYGTSGGARSARIYSYEYGNNPKGIFVSSDLSVVKRAGFGDGSGVIMEFACKVSDLEAPVWAGGGSYFVQGQMTKTFKDDDEREQQRLINRERERKSNTPSIADSDRPELAETLFQNAEKQALFTGDLNPNMIRAFWVNEPMMNGKMGGTWERMSRDEFMKRYFDESKVMVSERTFKGYEKTLDDRYRKAGQRLFKPNDDLDMTVFDATLAKYDIAQSEFIEHLLDGGIPIDSYMWPKQVKQFMEKYKNE